LDEANRTIKNVGFKFVVQQRISRSIAFHGNPYEAVENIPPTISPVEKTIFLWNILYGFAEGQADQNPVWKKYNDNHRWFYARLITYDNENN
jgi:hypothetical protein